MVSGLVKALDQRTRAPPEEMVVAVQGVFEGINIKVNVNSYPLPYSFKKIPKKYSDAGGSQSLQNSVLLASLNHL